MNQPLFIDSNQREWHECEAPKFVNTSLKILYDKESGMSERVYYTRVQPGGFIDKHDHPTTEVFYVISGQGVVTAGDQEIGDIAGKVFFMKPGLEHGLRNTGQSDVLLVSFANHP